MWCYLSYLNETFVYDRIEVNFLIVGHTHAKIDQYFSVLSRAIKNSPFIGSPLALIHLIANAHSDKGDRPAFVRQIHVYYDVNGYFSPYMNDKVKVYKFLYYILQMNII